jgi:prevent-host-death family protein
MFKMVNLIELADLSNMAAVPIAEPSMETIAAADAKTNFGALLDKAQRGPVTISKNGRAVAVLMSAEAYAEQQQLKLEVLRREIRKGLDDVKRGRLVTPERAFAAVDRELRKLRKK